jgi:hypothetical protein
VAIAALGLALAGAIPSPPAPRPAAPPPALPSPPPPREPPGWREAAAGGPLSRAEGRQRRRRFLETALRQMHRLAKIEHPLDVQRLAAGALTAAALATAGAGAAAGTGSGGTAPAADAARWTGQLLDECTGRWEQVECARAELSLQRLVLSHPAAVPPALLARARAAAAAAAPPPPAAETASPWSFRDTENQRAVRMARSLVAPVVAGTPDSAAAHAWGDYAAAFLAAHDRDGWYEAESPGYMAISITALLHLADLAPAARERGLARRELDLLLAAWAQQQVAGYPAGPRSRTYVQWALGDRTTPWRAWAWLAASLGDPAHLAFADWPELALSGYETPFPVAQLLRDRRAQPSYEIRTRRRIDRDGRTVLDAALYAFATPDYVLGAAQAIAGLRLGVAGGEEIAATLYPEGPDFAPLYLWSRTRNTPEGRWQSQAERDLAVGARATAVAYLAAGKAGKAGDAPAAAVGHAYLAAPWSRPEPVGEARETVVSWCGDTYVALTTAGGWEVAPAARRFPDYYGEGFASSWVAVPRRQPAAIGLLAGRRAEDGDLAAWRRRAARASLVRDGSTLTFAPAGGAPTIVYVPGERATIGGAALLSGGAPGLAAPFLSSPAPGVWDFTFGAVRRRFDPLP